jgi:hypothetical protein
MPGFDVSINVLVLLSILAFAVLTGFAFRSEQLRRKNRQIGDLEREMMQAYAELLESQKDYCELKDRLKGDDSPVISIKETQSQNPGKQPGSSKVRKNG